MLSGPFSLIETLAVIGKQNNVSSACWAVVIRHAHVPVDAEAKD